jgi:hypothetical protein
MLVTTSGRSGAPKAWRTATYDGTIIYNDPVLNGPFLSTYSKYHYYLSASGLNWFYQNSSLYIFANCNKL